MCVCVWVLQHAGTEDSSESRGTSVHSEHHLDDVRHEEEKTKEKEEEEEGLSVSSRLHVG